MQHMSHHQLGVIDTTLQVRVEDSTNYFITYRKETITWTKMKHTLQKF